MRNRALEFSVCLLLMIGTANVGNAAEHRAPTVDHLSPVEGIVQWMHDWVDRVRTTWVSVAAADPHEQISRADSNGPGEETATGAHGQNPSTGSDPSEDDDGLLETGPQIEPLG